MGSVSAEHIKAFIVRANTAHETRVVYSVCVSFTLNTLVTYEYPIGSSEQVDEEHSTSVLVKNILVSSDSEVLCQLLQKKLCKMSNAQLQQLAVDLGWIESSEEFDARIIALYETPSLAHRLYLNGKRKLVKPCVELHYREYLATKEVHCGT